MLRENMDARPNIYQVLKESCAMQGKDAPVKDVRTNPDAQTLTLLSLLFQLPDNLHRSIPVVHSLSLEELLQLLLQKNRRQVSQSWVPYMRLHRSNNNRFLTLCPCGEAA